MPVRALFALLMVALCSACSNGQDSSTDATPNPAATVVAPAASSDPDVAVRMGMVFTDTDPQLMGGGQVVRGTLHVGDRLDLFNSKGARSEVRIDEIKEDASGERVSEAKAPAGIFLIFSADVRGRAGSDNVLVAHGSFSDFASAKAFVNAQAE